MDLTSLATKTTRSFSFLESLKRYVKLTPKGPFSSSNPLSPKKYKTIQKGWVFDSFNEPNNTSARSFCAIIPRVQKKSVLDHVNCSTEHLHWMSTAPWSTCVECQLQQRPPALSEFWHVEASFLKVSVPRKLPKWHLDQRNRLVIDKRY